MWWLVVLFAVVVLLGVVLERRRRAGIGGGSPGEAPYDASTAAAQNARSIDRGGMGG